MYNLPNIYNMYNKDSSESDNDDNLFGNNIRNNLIRNRRSLEKAKNYFGGEKCLVLERRTY